jgi:fructokinase
MGQFISMEGKVFAGVEAGGTKFICAVGTSKRILNSVSIPTIDPHQTVTQALAFFDEQRIKLGEFAGLGVGSFGPLDLDPESGSFGYIGKTPKLKWSDFDLISAFRSLNCPIGIETDVNAAGLAEATLGGGKNKKVVLYVTIGTGIGVGVIFDKTCFRGRSHPEIGHMIISKDSSDSDFTGVCPYHENCLEGLASGPAIEKRWGVPLSKLPVGHPAQSLQSGYISALCANLILSFSPEIILIGGGVMKAPALLDKVHGDVLRLLGGYISSVETLDDVKSLIKTPELGDQAGIFGSLLLAERALSAP